MSAEKSGYLKVIFSQFTFLQAVRQVLIRILRALLDPHCIPSYGHTGEDRIIESCFPNKSSGFYVDVGCNDPVVNSNTFKLYRRGWRGINIDANAALIAKFAALRPRDCNVCAIVSDVEEDKQFGVYGDSLFSTVSPQRMHELQSSRPLVRMDVARSRKLTNILEENGAPSRFELLTIDVEGHDLEVLRSLDLGRYQPELIVIEMHGFDVTAPAGNPVYDYLAECGYKLSSYALMNGFFIRVGE